MPDLMKSASIIANRELWLELTPLIDSLNLVLSASRALSPNIASRTTLDTDTAEAESGLGGLSTTALKASLLIFLLTAQPDVLHSSRTTWRGLQYVVL
jgi:hypothetical protein